MKKIKRIFSTVALAAVVTVSASTSAFAAGINSAEQKILDTLNTTVTMNGVEKSIPAGYLNQAENYFNTVEITDEEADKIVSAIEDAKAYLESTGAANVGALTVDQANTVVSKVQAGLSVIGLTLQYTKSTGAVSIVDKSGNTVFSTTLAASGSSSAGGNTAGENPIKTTGLGFNVPGIAVIAGLGIVLVSATGLYVIKRASKSKSTYGTQA